MAERLTEEQMDLLAADVARSSDRWARDRVLSLLTEVRERREQDRRKANSRFEDRYVHKQMFTATLERAHEAGARVAELEAALRECVATHDGWHEEDCQASGYEDAETFSEPGPDPFCDCGAKSVRDRARAALAKGEK